MQTITRAATLPPTTPERGVRVALAQRSSLLRQLDLLTASDWDAPTECTPWRVRDIVAHIAGELVYTRNPLAFLGLVATWRRRFGDLDFLDGTNEAAVQARRTWPVERLLAEYRRDIGRAVPPRWSRGLPLGGQGGLPPGATFAYLTDVVLPRDTWMHRHDIARATGTAVPADPTDAEVVAQVVRELALAWTGPDSELRLTGPAGGTWLLGDGDGEPVELPAVGLMRLLSGRVAEPDLLASVPEPVRTTLAGARVIF